MGVDVENRLPTPHTGIEHQTEIAISVLGGEIAGDLHHFLEQRWIARGKLGHISVCLRCGDNEKVNRRLWRDIAQSNDALVLEHNVRRDFPGNDAGENRGLAHEPQSRTWLQHPHPVITSAP